MQFLLLFGLCFVGLSYAGGGGAGVLGVATAQIKGYWEGAETLIKAVGGLVGIIGALRIYNKWSNGDQDINKEILAWGGAAIFLILGPTFIKTFFN